MIKSMEQNFRKIEGVAGATILGDGTVGSFWMSAGCSIFLDRVRPRRRKPHILKRLRRRFHGKAGRRRWLNRSPQTKS